MKTSRTKKLAGLYAITDATVSNPDKIVRSVEQVLHGGARLIQYRDKSGSKEHRLKVCIALRDLTQQFDALFIVNDDVELSKASNADGVHLGQHDISMADARIQLGHNSIIGISCYNRFDLAEQAEKEGADYIAFGSFFPSNTKPNASCAEINLLQRAKQELNIPVVAIGGITSENGKKLIDAGADMLAVVNDIFAQPNIEAAAKRFQSIFN